MRNLLLACCLLGLFACKEEVKQPTQWEYKIVSFDGMEYDKQPKFHQLFFEDVEPEMNELGKKGWELVDTYTEESTAFPNFGDDKYVTGIKENVRTHRVNFVFKRQCLTQKKKDAKK